MKSAKWFVGVALVSACSASVLASLPDDYVINYNIRKTPTDPESDITYTISLELTAISTNGDEVGWEVVEAFVDDMESNKSWRQVYPELVTSDGLWWVEHGDPEAPEAIDFIYPPTLDGYAASELVGGEDLYYHLHTISSCAGCNASMYNGRVAFASYTVDDPEDPDVDEEDDGPVESDIDPPT